MSLHQRIKLVLEHLKQGKPVILCDEENRENEGDIILPAEFITPEKMNFIIRNTSGIVCLTLTAEKAAQLNLRPMLMGSDNTNPFQSPFTVSIEAKRGVTTGVSASDRTCTVLAAIQDDATKNDLTSPGHIFPLVAHPHGLLGRGGHTEGSIDLMRLAGLKPAAVLCEIMNADGSMTRGAALEKFAAEHQMPVVTTQELRHYRRQTESLVTLEAQSSLTLADVGEFSVSVFKESVSQETSIVLHKATGNPNPLVRIHSSCTTGDIFASLHCDCHYQLHYALRQIQKHGGYLIYLNQEGRGIGLINKIKAYALQKTGLDTAEANLQLGCPVDAREYHLAYQILKYFNINALTLLTNNPAKIQALQAYDLVACMAKIPAQHHPLTTRYLKTKQEKLNHEIEYID